MAMRVHIPIDLRRKLLVECGHKCTIHNCNVMRDLEAHHIDSNPSHNTMINIIILCPNHHAMADRGDIDRKACREYKRLLKNIEVYPATLILKNIEQVNAKISTLMKETTRKSKMRVNKK